MSLRRVSVLASIAVLGTTISLSAQQSAPSARLLRAEGGVTIDGQPVAAGAAGLTLGDAADIQTTDGRVAIALKRGGTFVLGPNTSARVLANSVFNFNRIEMLAGSAMLLSASNSGLVGCSTDARLSSDGVFRFDVIQPDRADGSQRCRMRVYDGAASTPGVSMSYVLHGGQEMVMSIRAGDMIPVVPLAAGAPDDLDRWARGQAAVSH